MKNRPSSLEKQLKKLAALPDKAIDTSDIPPLGDDFWNTAVQNPFYRPIKQSKTLRIDADVLLWLKKEGRGYQTRINYILRNAMQQDLGRKHKKWHFSSSGK